MAKYVVYVMYGRMEKVHEAHVESEKDLVAEYTKALQNPNENTSFGGERCAFITDSVIAVAKLPESKL